MKKARSLAAASLVLVLFGQSYSIATAAEPAAVNPPNASDDALLRRLEQTGALDRAADRAIARYVERQNAVRRKAQQEAEAKAQDLAKKARPVDAGRDHLWGDAKATVSIIEYSDFECPYCKGFYGAPEEVVKRFAGKVNFVWRQFPLPMHGRTAMREAQAAECAGLVGGSDTYWRYAEEIMRQTRSNGQGLPVSGGDPLVALAKELKLDATAFGKCLDSPDAKKTIDEDIKDGADAGITGTPGVILRNSNTGKTLLVPGAVAVDELQAMVQELLSLK